MITRPLACQAATVTVRTKFPLKKLVRKGWGYYRNYFPKKTMVLQDQDVALSGHPANTRRQAGSGPPGVKYATGHKAVLQQAPCGNWATAAHDTPLYKKTAILKKHRSLSLATWNVRGLSRTGNVEVVEREMDRYQIDILGMTETHVGDTGHYKSTSGKMVIVSGNPQNTYTGVAAFITKGLADKVIGYNCVNDRILSVKLGAHPNPMHIIIVYAPTSVSSEEVISEFYGILDRLVQDIPKKEPIVIMGDLNAKVGITDSDHHLRNVVGKFGLGVRNDRGERLLDFCAGNSLAIMNTWFQQHPRRLYTWTSPNGLYRNQIDYIIVSQRWRSSISTVKTRPGADCGSDHQLLAAKFRIRLKSTPAVKTNKPIHFNGPAQKLYREEVSPKLQSLEIDPFEAPEASWANLKTTIKEVAKQAADRCKTVSPRAEWISAEAWCMIQQRKALKIGGLKSEEERTQYAKVHRTVQRLCRKDRESFIDKICTDLEKYSELANTRDMFQKVKVLAKEFKPKQWTIENEIGVPITDKVAILERWRNYCQQLYSEPTTDATDVARVEYTQREPDILRQEIEDAIAKLKPKACGSDGVTAQMLQNMGSEGIKVMHIICQKIWRTGQWPEDWTESTVVPLHKKGSTRKCENYRTISLISHASKVLLRILNRRLESYIGRQIAKEQAGFVRGKGTREQILNIRQLIEKCREHNICAVLCFIDYAKAFDCINWSRMFDVMSEMGVPDHLTFLVQNLYLTSKSRVRLEDALSQPFYPERGVRQGCILSPQLFNLIGEHIMRRVLDNWEGGIRVGGYLINNLRFADDTTIIGASETELFELLSRISATSQEYGLLINRGKTKLMFVDRAGTTQRTNELCDLDVVHKFVYLGSQISDDGDCEQEVVRRAQMAKSAVKRLEKLWRNRGINRKTKIKLMRTLIFSIFLYASETWTLKARVRSRIDAFEMWCWRKMLRISWTERRTNESILKELHVKKRLSTICRERVLKFFGHTVRRDPDSLERLLITGAVEGKRGRGRSPTRWTDTTQEATGTTLQTAVQLAQDRVAWRTMVARHHSHVPQS